MRSHLARLKEPAPHRYQEVDHDARQRSSNRRNLKESAQRKRHVYLAERDRVVPTIRGAAREPDSAQSDNDAHRQATRNASQVPVGGLHRGGRLDQQEDDRERTDLADESRRSFAFAHSPHDASKQNAE